MALFLIIFAVLISLINGGRIKNLFKMNLKYSWFLVITALLNIAVLLCITRFNLAHRRELMMVYPYLNLFTFFVMIFFSIANNKYFAFNIIAIGLALNLMAMINYAGFMPVLKEALVYNGSVHELAALENSLSMTHTLLVSGKTFNVLADTIPIGKFISFKTVISIGDIFLSLGLFMLVEDVMKRRS